MELQRKPFKEKITHTKKIPDDVTMMSMHIFVLFLSSIDNNKTNYVCINSMHHCWSKRHSKCFIWSICNTFKIYDIIWWRHNYAKSILLYIICSTSPKLQFGVLIFMIFDAQSRYSPVGSLKIQPPILNDGVCRAATDKLTYKQNKEKQAQRRAAAGRSRHKSHGVIQY